MTGKLDDSSCLDVKTEKTCKTASEKISRRLLWTNKSALNSGTPPFKEQKGQLLHTAAATVIRTMGPVTRSQAVLRNAVMNDVVLLNLFDFLSVEDLKRCRLVCMKWKRISGPVLRQKAAIILKDFSDDPETKNPTVLQRTFQNGQTAPFTGYNICPEGFVAINKMLQFLKSINDDVTHLALHNVGFSDKYWLSTIIPLLAHEESPNLKKLKVVYLTSRKWTAAWSTVSLQAVTDLTLVGVVLLIAPGGQKITPRSLTLRQMKFNAGDVRVHKPIINTFVDLSKCRTFCLEENITLDMNMTLNADSVELSNIKMINWEKANGYISNLVVYFTDFNFGLRPQLIIKRLVLNCSFINLAALPKSVEELILTFCKFSANGSMVHLPNLRYLKLQARHDTSSPLQYFKKCERLFKLEMVSFRARKRRPLLRLDLSTLPPTLVKLGIFGHFKIVGRGYHQVENIFIRHGTMQKKSINILMKRLHPTNVVYEICRGGNAKYIHQILKPYVPRFVVGMVDWSSIAFQDSKLSKLATTEAKFYFFIDGKDGIPIYKKCFYSFGAGW